MKKLYLLFSFVGMFSLAKAQFPAPYCPEAYSSSVEPITNVEFGTIANTSSDVVGGADHEDYTAISTDVTQGATYTIKVQGNTDGNYSDYIVVFFDWNQDGDFLDAGEKYNVGIVKNSTGLDTISASASIAIPIGATLGATRMRVAKKWNAYQSSCNTSGYGEAEDYTVNVVASPACSGAPAVATASGPASSCQDSMITVSVSGITSATGITYQWQSSNIGANIWTNVSGAVNATENIQLGAGGKDFRCVLTCSSSSLSTNSTIITVTSYSCAHPVNDDACDAITLVLDGPKDCQNTLYATSTNDPTSFTCSTPNNTTWYKYTPTTTGNVQFTLESDSVGGLNGWLGIYEAIGTCPGGLTFTDITTANGGCKSFGSSPGLSTKILLNLNAGTEYYFMVDGVSGAKGKYCISIQTPPPPPATCVQTTVPAAAAIDVPAPSTTLKWTPVSNTTSYDVYLGTVNPPTTIKGNSTTDSLVVSGLAYSTQYYWYVLPKNSGGSPTGCDATATDFTTSAPPPPPSNDDCDSAFIVNAGATLLGSTLSATQTNPAQACSGFTGTADDDVWFKFTANQNGDADITLVPIGSSFDAVVVAYSGTCDSLLQIGCADTSFSGGTEIVHLTGLNAGETYIFRVYSYSSLATGQGQFNIKVQGSALLPVTLAKFIGERKGSINLLSWTTATETNNKGFQIQKSYDGTAFMPLAFVNSKSSNGNSVLKNNYQFEDSKPFSGVTYYRLNQIDINGKSTLSNIVAIKGDKVTSLTISEIYPNPTTQNINVVISSPVNDNANLLITDITGKVVKNQTVVTTAGNTNVNVEVSNLAKGTYLMKIICNNGCNSAVAKFVKQ